MRTGDVLRRLPWAICCALFVALVPASASWAVTAGWSESLASSPRPAGWSWGWSVDEPPNGCEELPGGCESPAAEPDPTPSASAAPAEPTPTVTVTAEPEPEPTPTVTVTAEPEPEAEAAVTTETTTEAQLVVLDSEQMAVLLLGVCLGVLCLGAMTVRSFMPGGE